jgi:hypothetical protein
METIVTRFIIVISVPWPATSVALPDVVVWLCNRIGAPPLGCSAIGLSSWGCDRHSGDSTWAAHAGLGSLLGGPRAPLGWRLRRSLVGLMEPFTRSTSLVGRPRRGIMLTRISSTRAACLRRSCRRARRGSIVGCRYDNRCDKAPSSFRVLSGYTLRLRSPRLQVASQWPHGPRCITTDYRPTIDMVRPGRGPGSKAPRSPHITVNALNLHHQTEDRLVLDQGFLNGRCR